MPGPMQVAKDDDFEVSFHPAFASRCRIARNGTEKETYRQDPLKPYVLDAKAGEAAPPTHHQIQVRCADGRIITLTVDDPDHCIAQIQLRLYDEKRDRMRRPLKGGVKAMEGDNAPGGTVVTIDNDATTCPPDCDNPGDNPPAGGGG